MKRPDASNGRIRRLVITPDGKRLAERCKVRADRIETLLQSKLKPSAERAVRDWLAALARELPQDD